MSPAVRERIDRWPAPGGEKAGRGRGRVLGTRPAATAGGARAALPMLLPACLADLWIDRLRVANFDPFDGQVQAEAPWRMLRLATARLRRPFLKRYGFSANRRRRARKLRAGCRRRWIERVGPRRCAVPAIAEMLRSVEFSWFGRSRRDGVSRLPAAVDGDLTAAAGTGLPPALPANRVWRESFLLAAHVADGDEEMGDPVIAPIDRDIGGGHAPAIASLHVGAIADAGLRRRQIVGIYCLEQLPGRLVVDWQATRTPANRRRNPATPRTVTRQAARIRKG